MAALLTALLAAPEDLPVGVFRSAPAAWESTRFHWAAEQIAAELAAAPGVAVDAAVGLAVVWEWATAELPHGPSPARGWGRRIATTQASWARELAKRLGSQMSATTRAAFLAGINDIGWMRMKSAPPLRPRPRADAFEADLAVTKRLEHQLRAGFPDVDDLGERPGVADRRAFVQAMAAGFSAEQVQDALRGQAEKCVKNRRWRDIDVAQVFLRITWLCAETRRLERAEQVGASLRQDPTGIVTGPAGNFAHGLEIVLE